MCLPIRAGLVETPGSTFSAWLWQASRVMTSATELYAGDTDGNSVRVGRSTRVRAVHE